jgi:hypothetical protein
MSGKPRLIYWDTCVFLAWIKGESCWPEDVTKGIEQIVEQNAAKEVILVTSVITLAEILQANLTVEQKDKVAGIFRNPTLQLIDVDRRVAGKAATIRAAYDSRTFNPDGAVKSGSIMGMGDSIHLATAVHFEVHEFQTLDGAGRRKRRFDLLTLDGNVAGARLAIKTPQYVVPPQPLTGPVPEPVHGAQLSLLRDDKTGGPDEQYERAKPGTEINQQGTTKAGA